MGTKMLATGTLSSLQERYGGAFVVRAVRAPDTDAAIVEQQVKKLFNNSVKEYHDSHGQVTFALPHIKSHLGSIMTIMEELKGDKMEEEVAEGQAAVVMGGSSRAGGSSAAPRPESLSCLDHGHPAADDRRRPAPPGRPFHRSRIAEGRSRPGPLGAPGPSDGTRRDRRYLISHIQRIGACFSAAPVFLLR